MTRAPADPTTDLLVKILASTPRLEEAACIGRTELFDPQMDGEPAAETTYRHLRAAALCRECPALASCRDWASTERSAGVIAGKVPPLRGRPGRTNKGE